uniref:uncharacterized protein LOC122578693 n=1 Tax=Erigeron canadensis TaxID=72917 RepID=UPI001CB9C324|nr:uncharacterized protein LOC122578693 [Erigeron canadensis]
MKFFFSELGFCFGGTVITPALETVSSTNVVPNTTRRRSKLGSSGGKHWRPELSVISEDGGTTPLNVCRQAPHESAVSVVRSHKKPLNKARSAGKTRSHSYGGDYRKFSHAMPMPAFSPTPFVF